MRADGVITAGLVLIRDGSLLLVQPAGKSVYYLPGGQIDGDETPVEALHRELREELDVGIVDGTLRFFHEVTAPAWGFDDQTLVTMHCYVGELDAPPRPSGEIVRLGWFSAAEYSRQLEQAPAVCKLFELLAHNPMSGLKPNQPRLTDG
jgi:8-oxo-dGTP diphosphatase